MNTNTHSDIKTNNRIINALPPSARPYAYLARLDRPIGIWLLLLPGWWAIMLSSGGILSMDIHDWTVFLLFGIGAVVMRAAGCVINDLWDRDLDRKVERTRLRPLAAEDISFKQGSVFLLILLLIALIILLQMEPVTILLGFLSLPLIGLYPLMKRWTWWPQAFLGLTFNFSALMGWSAITGILEPPALLLYAGCIFWTLGYDTIYAHQDKDCDALAGIRSTALKFGQNSRIWVGGFYGAALFLIGLGGLKAGAGIGFYALLAAAGFHLLRQVQCWNVDIPRSALDTFRSNRDFGLLVLLASALSGF